MRLRLALFSLLATCGFALAEPAGPAPAATESVHEALCRLIESAAREHGVAADFLTNLIWRESSFRPHVVSHKGAQGIAQFMPSTAAKRGLVDPFDPEQAIPEAARLIAEHLAEFGNLGLAAAAYNAGAARVARWLAREVGLPPETRNFVALVTGLSPDEWAALRHKPEPPRVAPASCATVVATVRRGRPAEPATPAPSGEDAPFAPWGVQLAGNFSKERALASFARSAERYAAALGEVRPMIIGTRLRSRGARPFYRMRVPAGSRAEANTLCARIRAAGGACVVLRS
jgi:hypothetical protein